MKTLTDQLKEARGARYFDILRLISFSGIGDCIADDVRAIRKKNGKVTIVDIAEMAIVYDLNVKAVFDIGNKRGVLPAGLHDKFFQKHKVSVGDILEKARERMEPLPDCAHEYDHVWDEEDDGETTDYYTCSLCGKQKDIVWISDPDSDHYEETYYEVEYWEDRIKC